MKKQQEPSPSVGLAATAAPQVSSSQSATQVTLEGLLKKRGARMHRWSTRYIILQGSKLSYKIKKDSPTLRGSFDLVPGCILTEIQDESQMKGKKLFSFWVVWPQDKSGEPEEKIAEDSDEEEQREEGVGGTMGMKSKDELYKQKDLKHIVHSEAMTAELQRKKAADQLQRHHSQDANLNMGMKVAAVTVGGVVVGALTAGIGLVPYMAVVGLVAAASGGAVALQYRRPLDSRLILASEDLAYITQWRAAIEEEITRLEMQCKPLLPADADPNVISHILGISAAGGLAGWTRVGIIEGMRVLEQVDTLDGSICRKAQLAVKCSPINCFVVLMDVSNLSWPKRGFFKVAHTVDDHVDILELNCPQRRPRARSFFSAFCHPESSLSDQLTDHGGPMKCILNNATSPSKDHDEVFVCGYLSRFWRLDDDGSYIIILTNTNANDHAGALKEPAEKSPNNVAIPHLTVVCTVSPRRDYEQFDEDIPLALMSCTVQVHDVTEPWTDKSFLDSFLTNYLTSLLEVRQAITIAKYDLQNVHKENVSPDHSGHGTGKTAYLGLPPSAGTHYYNFDDYMMAYYNYYSPERASHRRHSTTLRPDGVTTVQPGMELLEITKMQRIPSQPKSSFGTEEGVPSGDTSRSPHRNASVGHTNSSNVSPALVVKKKRSRKEKADASNLRNLIATKEYELHRQEKLIQKKGSLGAAQKLSQASEFQLSPAGSAQELIHVISSLKSDINEMKDSYQKLTGVSYESSTRKKFLNRMRGKDKMKQDRFNAAYAAAVATGDVSSPKDAEKSLREKPVLEGRALFSVNSESDNEGDIAGTPYPIVWRQARKQEQIHAHNIRLGFTRGASRQNLILIGFYILAMLVAAIMERQSAVVVISLDLLLHPYGVSSSLICTSVDRYADDFCSIIRRSYVTLYQLIMNAGLSVVSAFNAFVNHLLMAPEGTSS